MAKEVGKALQMLQRFIKPPWKVTGPAASPEFLESLPKVVEYRKHAPASTPTRASVPQAEPELVYNIQYYTRDHRRNPSLRGWGTVNVEVDPNNYKGELEALEASVARHPNHQRPFYWGTPKRRALLDHSEDGGYC